MRRIERKRFFAWQALLSPFAPCRRSGQRVAVQVLYTRFYLDFQGKSGIPGPSRTYPELFALLGGKLPDLRGLFLRGHGGKSAGLMVKQDDAGRNLVGEFSQNPGAEGLTGAQFGEAIDQFEGAFRPTKMAWRYAIADAPASGGATTALGIVLDASRSWGKNHTTDSANGEFRPANQAVRYLVRARP